jgi:hypothetical protein
MSAEWTLRQAMTCLIGSTLCTLLLALIPIHFWKKGRHARLTDPRFQITAIIQTGPEKQALKTTYLAELLGLSSDQPISLYALNCERAKEKLLASPLIASAHVKRLPPSALYIDYEVRKPIARLADYQNVALDREGHLFPLDPFLPPKELPELYLGLPSFGGPTDRFGRKGGLWQTPLEGRHFRLALEILQTLEQSPWQSEFRVKRIDVSNAFAESLGIREIVLSIEEEIILDRSGQPLICTFPKLLRLSPKDYPRQLVHYQALKRGITEQYKRQLATAELAGGRFSPRIVDLRIPQLAFIENK